MSIIEGLRTYFAGCPLLNENGRLNVDFLGAEAIEYVIDSVPCEPVLSRYADGGSKRRFLFVFASREAYGADTLNNMVNCGFYEQFADWIEAQNKARNYPALPAGKTSLDIRALTCGYLFDAGPETGRYQIQCQLTYYQEG